MTYLELLRTAYKLAASSPDPSTKNGALLVSPAGLVIAKGINTFPPGVLATEERLTNRAIKLKTIEHAERAAIYDAARRGVPTQGMTMVCPWAACSDCARGIVSAGINKLVTHKLAFDRSPERWLEEVRLGMQILEEGGVEILMYPDRVFADNEFSAQHSGEYWQP